MMLLHEREGGLKKELQQGCKTHGKILVGCFVKEDEPMDRTSMTGTRKKWRSGIFDQRDPFQSGVWGSRVGRGGE